PSIPSQLSPVTRFIRNTLLPAFQSLEAHTHSYPTLLAIYKSTSIPPVSFAIALILACFYALRRATRANMPLVSNLFGVIWPAYRSLRAVERPVADDDERWLTYWPAFGVFTILDQFQERIRRYFPLYFTSKVIVLYWLFQRDGALALYRKVARPLLINYNGLNASNSSVSGATTAVHSRETTPYKV
ncbi:hypothetical protein HK101_000349, partial [Irineochytrium annulatum]